MAFCGMVLLLVLEPVRDHKLALILKDPAGERGREEEVGDARVVVVVGLMR